MSGRIDMFVEVRWTLNIQVVGLVQYFGGFLLSTPSLGRVMIDIYSYILENIHDKRNESLTNENASSCLWIGYTCRCVMALNLIIFIASDLEKIQALIKQKYPLQNPGGQYLYAI